MVIATVNHVSGGAEHAQVLTSTAAAASNNNTNSNNVAATVTTAGGAVIGGGGGGGAGGPGPGAIEHFNLTTIGELSNVQLSNINAQLVGGTVTADGSLVTMGGIVVGRLHHASISNHQHNNNPQPLLHRSTQQTQTSQADLQQHQPQQQQQPQPGGVIKIETQSEFITEG